ncbi:MAG: SdpI family protein [Calditrichaceae bacterium]
MDIGTDLISRFWVPILFIIISIPLIFEKIPPNHTLGFRSKSTLSNKQLWYKANKLFGWYIFCAGLMLIIYRILEKYLGIIHIQFEAIVSIVVIISLIALVIHVSKVEI